MAGKIYSMINQIISQKSKGNDVIASSVRTKMILKGIKVKDYSAASADDQAVITKLQDIAKEFGVKV